VRRSESERRVVMKLRCVLCVALAGMLAGALALKLMA
jgi:hypothetical protein